MNPEPSLTWLLQERRRGSRTFRRDGIKARKSFFADRMGPVARPRQPWRRLCLCARLGPLRFWIFDFSATVRVSRTKSNQFGVNNPSPPAKVPFRARLARTLAPPGQLLKLGYWCFPGLSAIVPQSGTTAEAWGLKFGASAPAATRPTQSHLVKVKLAIRIQSRDRLAPTLGPPGQFPKCVYLGPSAVRI